MASLAVATAVQARLDANPLPGFPAFQPNGPGDAPEDKSPFVSVEYPVARSEQITFGSPGSNTFRETGTVQFVIASRRGGGTASGLQVADEIRGLFRNVQVGPLRFWEPGPPLTNNDNQDGAYYRLSVSVEYWLDFWA